MFDTPLFANLTSGLVTVPTAMDAVEVENALTALDWQVCPVACGELSDKAGFIEAIAGALEFPDWTGRNWDALSDAVTDLSWFSANRAALVLHGTDDLATVAPDVWRTGREILGDAVEWWTDHDRALLVVFH